MEPVRKTIGVLALQGAFREHRRMLEGLGADTRLVRWPSELERLDGLVIPGGESTAIAKLLAIHGMYGPLRAAHAAGMAVFGTCAGAILMARDIEGAPVKGVFIRAPRFADLGEGVEVLSTSEDGEPLAVREGRALAAAFHPELTDDSRVHAFFLERVVGS